MGAQLAFDGASPSAGLDPVDQGPLRALFADCHCCEATEAFPSTLGLPAGWLEIADERAANGKAVLCPDCRSLADEPTPIEADQVKEPGLVFCGYRLRHQLHAAAGFATLRLQGGERSRPGAELPAIFLVDRAGLQGLIGELQAIDAELAQQGVN